MAAFLLSADSTEMLQKKIKGFQKNKEYKMDKYPN
jgi:hypothetical protein